MESLSPWGRGFVCGGTLASVVFKYVVLGLRLALQILFKERKFPLTHASLDLYLVEGDDESERVPS